MKKAKIVSALLALAMLLSLAACGAAPETPAVQPAEQPAAEQPTEAPAAETPAESGEITVTDLIGREVTVAPGSYRRVVCIGAGALRLYSYVGDVSLLCGVEDIDNETLAERPKMFDSVARPYVLAYGDVFAALPSCGVGGPNAQSPEAEKILTCEPDIVISLYGDADKANALQEQLGVPVVTLMTGPDGVFDSQFNESIRLLGTVFAESDKAELLIGFIESECAEIEARTADIADADKPAVYICGLGNWGTTNHLMTSQDYASFRVANVRNAVTDLGAPGVQPIEAEKFAAIGEDMDIMIFDAAAVKNIRPLYAEDPAMLDTCRAWREGEAYLQLAYNAYYTNYEIALINTWFAAKVAYPDRFEDIDMNAVADKVTTAFLGEPLSEAINACPSSFGGYGKIDTASFFAGDNA